MFKIVLRVCLCFTLLTFNNCYAGNEYLYCKILDLILTDIEKESIFKRTYSYKDSVDETTGETYRIILKIHTDTIPDLRLKRNDLLISDDFFFFRADKCSSIQIINQSEIIGPLKEKKLYKVSGVTMDKGHLVVTILNSSEGSKSSYFFSVKGDDAMLEERKDW